ncbi:sensor domain-containing diguanylate cyclase [Rubripirellula reticaptiva]|nr:GAF domain-containing protein [Rubripirellula reticaptiva]
MVTRTEGDDWIVLDANDHGYGVAPGNVFSWADSFCSRMVLGKGPCIAPASQSIPAYVAAPIGQQVPIGAYIGIPLEDADGGLFGTLCAIDPEPQFAITENDLPLLRVTGRMLASILVAELKLSAIERNKSFSALKELIDPATKVLNANGWEQLVEAEENRCVKYGHPAQIFAIEMADNFDVSNITAAVERLKIFLPEDGAIARLAANEFLMIAPESSTSDGQQRLEAIRKHFRDAGIPMAIGVASRDPRLGMGPAIAAARQMQQAEIEARV